MPKAASTLQVIPKTPSTQAIKTVEAVAPKPSVTVRSKVTLKSIGINKMLNPQKEDSAEEKSVPLETKAFTEAELISVWKEYAEEIKERDLDIYTTLTRHIPKLTDRNIINLKLDNKAQEHEITDIKVDLMGFLRHRLNNYEVDLKTFIEKGTEEKGLYTSADKFKKMAQKNPALEELKKKLDLDLGF